MSANAEAVATAIATYLVEHGAHDIAGQITAIRVVCARPWLSRLRQHGFDAVGGMTLSDIADGVDLALARLVDAAQEVYDLCAISHEPYDKCDEMHEGDCEWQCGTCGGIWATCTCDGSTIMATPTTGNGKTQPAAHYLVAANTPATGGQ